MIAGGQARVAAPPGLRGARPARDRPVIDLEGNMRACRVPMLVATALVCLAPALRAGEIHQAVAAGDSDRVTRLLHADPGLVRVASEEAGAELPLHVAARAGRVGIARLLLDAGAAVDGPDSDESTPLDVAAVRRQRAVARLLLDRGANVNHRDRNGGYSLSFAVSGGDTAIVRMILAAGADLNYRSRQGGTLLPLAAQRGLWDVLDLLLRRGEDINQGTEWMGNQGVTPLHRAAFANDSARMVRLVSLGASVAAVDSSGMTPLMYSIERGMLRAASGLLAAGASPGAPNRSGLTAFALAVWRGNVDMVRLFLAHGADPNASDPGGQSLLFPAVQSRDSAMVAALLQAGALVAVTSPRGGRTPLHEAALTGSAAVARMLVERGADVNARDSLGTTPSELAARYGHSTVASLLAARGARRASSRDAGSGGLAFAGRLPEGAAAVWFLGHSGWGVKTKNHFLIFDYMFDAREPDRPGLCNGSVVPAELRGERVTVFVSHEHADHFDRRIFDWRERLPRISYVLGFRADTLPPHVFVGPRETREVEGMKITTIRANDSGVGFVVEVDGLVLFHAGDHANRHRDLTGDYTPEIEFLQAQGVKPDIAFLPATGCNFGDHVAVETGVEYALEKLSPALFLPMHAGSFGCDFGTCGTRSHERFPQMRVETVSNRGDHLRYQKEKVL
jgi:ankyrin repeat protein/L-ascorbate metabolism protein UlaG (beta-lactamase superfamily)